MGGAANQANVFRYAYDRGVNYFDVAESYNNGGTERALGEALQHMDRSKVFITTKVHFEASETEEGLLDRFSKCQERLRTEMVDALYIHSVSELSILDHGGFHGAVKRLKADGRLRFAGVSCHGPRGQQGESMAKILTAAASDGRFDLMLLVYNFMNSEEGEQVLAACKEHDVGTTAMKTAPGTVEADPYDPDNPSKEWAEYIERRMQRGDSREEVEKRIRDWIAEQEETFKKAAPFMEEHGITTREDLHTTAVKWVLSNPDLHTACIGFEDFESIDRFIPVSGTQLTGLESRALHHYRLARSNSYCRHGCTACVAACPEAVPVSTIMRYAYYFTGQGREKLAMTKYARLTGDGSSPCTGCAGHCVDACPFGVNIQSNLLRAHGLLTLA
jgi:predicted aldo/keto reductase-like oxidoreductase